MKDPGVAIEGLLHRNNLHHQVLMESQRGNGSQKPAVTWRMTETNSFFSSATWEIFRVSVHHRLFVLPEQLTEINLKMFLLRFVM